MRSYSKHSLNALREVVEELLGLVLLNLPVLHGGTTQIVIELNSFVGSYSSLVLRGFLTKPEVNVPLPTVCLSPRLNTNKL